jgi:uncharacterized membrane protein
MDRMLVIVFDSESKAYEGQKALFELDGEGSISVYASTVLKKNADGTATIKQGGDPGPVGAFLGTSFGSLVGVLGGPLGMAVGAAAGAVSGAAADLYYSNARVGYDFIDDVSKSLLPNRVAVVAEVEEQWTAPVDSRMETIGGTVFRRALSDVIDAAGAKDVDAMKADLAQLKAEHVQAKADRKSKLTEKMNQLDSKIQVHLQKNKERRQVIEREAKAKAEMLKSKTAAPRAKAS